MREGGGGGRVIERIECVTNYFSRCRSSYTSRDPGRSLPPQLQSPVGEQQRYIGFAYCLRLASSPGPVWPGNEARPQLH